MAFLAKAWAPQRERLNEVCVATWINKASEDDKGELIMTFILL